MAGLVVVALAGCGRDAPTSGSTTVSGSGSAWALASSSAETHQDGDDVTVLVKVKPRGVASGYIPSNVVGDLTTKYDGDASGEGTLRDYCTTEVSHARLWSDSSDDNTVAIRCHGTTIGDVVRVTLHDKAGTP